jgi:hypothetical protein
MRCFLVLERTRTPEKDISFKSINLFLPDGSLSEFPRLPFSVFKLMAARIAIDLKD